MLEESLKKRRLSRLITDNIIKYLTIGKLIQLNIAKIFFQITKIKRKYFDLFNLSDIQQWLPNQEAKIIIIQDDIQEAILTNHFKLFNSKSTERIKAKSNEASIFTINLNEITLPSCPLCYIFYYNNNILINCIYNDGNTIEKYIFILKYSGTVTINEFRVLDFKQIQFIYALIKLIKSKESCKEISDSFFGFLNVIVEFLLNTKSNNLILELSNRYLNSIESTKIILEEKLKSIRLSRIFKNSSEIAIFSQAIGYNIDEINELSFILNKLGFAELTCILNSIPNKDNYSLKSLLFQDNNFYDKSVKLIIEKIYNFKNLEALGLISINMSYYGCQYIADYLKVDTKLKSLNLMSNQIGDKGVKCLVDALKVNNTLNLLDMCECNISKIGAIYLNQLFNCNSGLISISLSVNLLNNEGIANMSAGLCLNTCLAKVYLSTNEISNEGSVYVARIIERNQSIKVLYLSYCNFGDEGIKLIGEALGINNSLEILYLPHNSINEVGAKYICDGLLSNRSLQSINLSSNQFGPKGAEYLSKVIKHNKTLTTYYFSNNSIGNQGAVIIADSLLLNTNIKSINLYNNNIGLKGKVRLALINTSSVFL